MYMSLLEMCIREQYCSQSFGIEFILQIEHPYFPSREVPLLPADLMTPLCLSVELAAS